MPEATPPHIRRADERFCTRVDAEGKETWHSFSFGNHYDPSRISFGPIMAINEERLAPGAGYEPHKHREVDILTWVLNGTLAHEDSTGFGGDVTPGTLQHLHAGPGVTHSERNASTTEPLVFVQMMVRANLASEPSYGQVEIPVVPGLHPGPEIDADASVFVARVDGQPLAVPAAASHLIHVTAGTLTVNGTALSAGDQWQGAAATPLELTALAPAEAIVWLLR